MMKTWYDRADTWSSFLSNMHSIIRLAVYQHCPRRPGAVKRH
jgi:hypothetical protein